MANSISIDPITRIEGHLAIKLDVQENAVSSAKVMGEMFRGFEVLLRGRDPLDAQQITQRICGVCPISHGISSVFAQDDAYGAKVPSNGRILRNMIQGANYLHSHIVHFYHLCALDFIDITAVLDYQGRDLALQDLKSWVKDQLASKSSFPAAPFLPRYDSTYIADPELNITAVKNYLDGLEMRAKAHKAAALFAAKLPHSTSLVPGGVTEKATSKKIAHYKSIMKELRQFIVHSYIPDVIGVAKALPGYFEVGRGCGNFLVYGVFPETDDGNQLTFPAGVLRNGNLEKLDISKITEQIKYSFFSSATNKHPSQGETIPAPNKSAESYSWLKAPRYDRLPMEVGPLARVLVAYHKGVHPELNSTIDKLLADLGAPASVLDSVLGRHAARALEAKIVVDRCLEWVEQLEVGKPCFADFEIPATGAGVGLTEAPRGALGHWLEIDDYRIKNYQCVVPTTWNCSPRDDSGVPGPVEQALAGTPVADPDNPIEGPRVVRSFDPCLACAVH